MLRDDIERYTELTGEDGSKVPIMKIGSFLDGYKKGAINVLDELKNEIDHMPSELTSDLRRMVRLYSVFDIIDRKRQREVKE